MMDFAPIRRRQWLAGLGAGGLSALAGTAHAGAALPISLRELVRVSQLALVGVVHDQYGQWEPDGKSQRIVTYSQLSVVESVDERVPPDSELYIRTLGGRVGDIGQVVHGEAELQRGEPSVLFLRESVPGTFSPVAMAQGHYPLLLDEDGTPRLSQSPRVGDFVRPDPHCAVNRLRGKTVASCRRLVLDELVP